MSRINSITFKIIAILILFILPLNIISFMSAKKSQEVIINQATSAVQMILNSSIIYLDNRIVESNFYLFDLITNDSYGITLYKQKGDNAYFNARYYIANKLQKNISLQNSPDIYFTYSPGLEDVLICKNAKYEFPRPWLSRELKALRLQDAAHTWQYFTFDDRQWLLHASSINGLICGRIFNMDEIIDETLSQLTLKNTRVWIDDSSDASAEPSGQICRSVSSQHAPLYIHAVLDETEILSSLPLFERIGFSMTILYLLLIPVLFILLNRILLRPLKKISSAMSRLRAGDKDYRIGHHKYAREFLNINETFNTMADSIEQLKIEKYENELARRKMELRSFQLQIRPHFLLNTFNLMFSLSQMDDRVNLENTILYMSDYFRYIFRSNQELESLRLELELIKNYLVVAAIRYPERFTVTYDIAPIMQEVRIPPLLIHNYVENIIRHALHDQSVVHIVIRAALHEDRAVIEVSDDGPGMDKVLMDKINNETLEVTDDNAHIGLLNSYQRIKYLLGKDATLKVSAGPDGGCRIKISFLPECV